MLVPMHMEWAQNCLEIEKVLPVSQYCCIKHIIH